MKLSYAMAWIGLAILCGTGTGTCCMDDTDDDGYTTDVDCDDNDQGTHPGAQEVCDGKDNDCDGVIPPTEQDLDQDGYVVCMGDCNDNNPDIHPKAAEPCTCDAIDQNCNGIIDDFPCDLACSYLQEGDKCGKEGQASCGAGLSCCYPCGIEGCENTCTPTCTDPWCANGCPMYP